MIPKRWTGRIAGSILGFLLCLASVWVAMTVTTHTGNASSTTAANTDERATGAPDRHALKFDLLLHRGTEDKTTPWETWEGLNPLLDLRSVFRPAAVDLSRAHAGTELRSCRWEVEGIADKSGGAPGEVEVSGAKVIRRYGEIEEQFLNREAGLQQVIRRKSGGTIGSGPDLVFDLETSLTAKVSNDGRTLLLMSGGESVLRYRLVELVDDLGHDLEPRMDLADLPGTLITRVRVIAGRPTGGFWSRAVGLWDTPKSPFRQATTEVVALTAPSNDLCQGAEIIPDAGPFPYLTSTVADITDATTTGDPPAPSCQPDVSRSIWYRFTPTTSADYTFSVCANGPTNTTVDDTVLAVYTSSPDGDCAGSFTEMAAVSPFASCDDDSCSNEALQSELTVHLEFGATYFILAWEFGSTPPTAGNQSVQLRVSQANPLPPPPSNDTCQGAETIPANGPFPYLTALINDIRGARTTGDPPPPSCAPVVSRSVWYVITPTESANYTFSTCADAPTGTTLDDTVVAVYTSDDGTCAGNLSEVAGACDDDSCNVGALQATVTASLEAGVTYYVLAWERGTALPPAKQAALQIQVTKSYPPPPPSNDLCAGAEAIPDGPYPWTSALISDVTGATTTGDPPAPSCGGALRSRSVWYSFTPGQTASYTFSSCAGDGLGTTLNDTLIAVYASDAGGCAGALTEAPGGCDDDGCLTEDSQAVATVSLLAGGTYYVVLWEKGVGVPAPGNTAVQLQVTRGSLAPANDSCSGADTIPDGPYPVLSPVTSDISGASTASDPSSASCQANRSRGVWYRFQPGASGYYRISTCSGDGTLTTVDDTVLSLYTSPAGCAGPFTEPATTLCMDACDDDSCATTNTQATLTTYLEGGTAYYLLVWKFGADPPLAGKTAVQVRVEKLPQPAAPANDDCAAAAVIPPDGPFPYTADLAGDITSASCAGDPSAPSCESATSRSVWYRLAPSRSGLFTFSTCSDAPTGTTVDDTVIGVYRASSDCSGTFQEIGCDDDSCGTQQLQAVASNVRLDAGNTYYAVVWEYGTQPPEAGKTAVQLRVDADFTPFNDRCEAAAPLELEVPVNGTTVSAGDSYQLQGSTCFTGVGQVPTTAPGPDVAYSFTAPADGEYSFKITGYSVGLPQDATLYVAQACEPGTAPVTVTSCLAASNRNTGGSSEEVACLPLTSGQTVYVFVDNADASGPGSEFSIEVDPCGRESEPNDTPAAADAVSCGLEGSITPAGDVDFHALGQPAAGSRVFALVDGVAANPSNSNFDLRVTTDTTTLEYDDANNDAEFGNLSPNVGGTQATGETLFLRVTQNSVSSEAEPYRLYAVTQGPAASAAPETEPNDTPATANAADYILGMLPGPSPSTDVDVYRFDAARGELWVVGLDGDAGYDGTPLNAKLEILDDGGAVLMTINDNGVTGNARVPAAGLDATTPFAPAEGLSFRAPATGTYYIRVSAGSGGANTSGDYLLSIAPECLPADADQDGIPNVIDCSWETPGSAPPGPVSGLALSQGASGDVTVSWQSPDPLSIPPLTYDVARGDLGTLHASGFPAGAACAATAAIGTQYLEPAAACAPTPGEGCWYLVRARSRCGAGTFAEPGAPQPHPLDGASSPCP